jgi:hypothetical protein
MLKINYLKSVPFRARRRVLGLIFPTILFSCTAPAWCSYGDTMIIKDITRCPDGWVVVNAPPPDLPGPFKIKDLREAKQGAVETVHGISPIPKGWVITESFEVMIAGAPSPESYGRIDKIALHVIQYSGKGIDGEPKSVMAWRSQHGGDLTPGSEAIMDAGHWDRVWRRLEKDTPPLDFKEYCAVLANAGQKPTGGYSIEFIAPLPQGDDLLIRWRVRQPKPGSVQSQEFTQPWEVQAFPRPKGEVLTEPIED